MLPLSELPLLLQRMLQALLREQIQVPNLSADEFCLSRMQLFLLPDTNLQMKVEMDLAKSCGFRQ